MNLSTLVDRGLIHGVVILLLAAACASHESSSADLDNPPLATITRELRLGSDADLLNAIGDLRVSPRNEVFVSQPATGQLLVFDDSGRLVRRLGRRGEGPGEYRGLGAFGFLGDTIWVDDRLARRMTLLGLDGTVVATIPYAPFDSSALAAILPPGLQRAASEYRYRTTAAVEVGGVSIVHPMVSPVDLEAVGVAATPLFTVTRDGQPVRVLATVPFTRFKYTSATGTRRTAASGTPPLDMDPRWAVSASGNRVAIVIPEPASSTLRILQLSSAGDTLSDHRLSFTPRALPPDFAERAARDIAEATRRPDDARAIQEAMRLPQSYPPTLSPQVEDRGVVWLKEYPHDQTLRWIGVGPDGTVISAFRLDIMQRLLLIDGSRLWIAETDRDGVESIIRYRIDLPD